MERWLAVTLLGVLACSDDAGNDRPADAAAPRDGGGSGFDAAVAPLDAALQDAAQGDANLEADASAALAWTRCDTRYECAKLRVPLDYGDPNAGSVELALKRLPTKEPTRIGSLLINPGGPGGSALDMLELLVEGEWLDDAVLDHFDVVAMDPRGVGESSPIDCHSTLQALFAARNPASDADWQALQAANQAFAEECRQKAGKLLAHMGTQDVARDLDRVRAAVGDDKLTYLGFSYGTVLGAWYAELFPTRVRALVLDGALDLSLSASDNALQQAQSFEGALSRYFAWCQSDASSCAWTQGAAPASAFAQLSTQIRAQPLPSKQADRAAGPGELIFGVGDPLYAGEDGWSALSEALELAVAGDGTGLVALADDYMERADDGSYSTIEESFTAVNCRDYATPPLATLRASFDEFKQKAPNFGASALAELTLCDSWPVQGVDVPPPSGKGAAPILVLGTTGDPATPYAWSQALAKQLTSGVLLTREGEGHTAYLMNNTCIDSAVESYLVDLTLPKVARCANETLPLMATPSPQALRKARVRPVRR